MLTHFFLSNWSPVRPIWVYQRKTKKRWQTCSIYQGELWSESWTNFVLFILVETPPVLREKEKTGNSGKRNTDSVFINKTSESALRAISTYTSIWCGIGCNIEKNSAESITTWWRYMIRYSTDPFSLPIMYLSRCRCSWQHVFDVICEEAE